MTKTIMLDMRNDGSAYISATTHLMFSGWNTRSTAAGFGDVVEIFFILRSRDGTRKTCVSERVTSKSAY